MPKERKPRPTKKTPEVIEEVLERVGNGETLMSIFEDDHLPSRIAFWAWCYKDKELDDLVFRAIRRGKLVHADIAATTQMKIMAGDHDADPRTLQAKVTAANNLGHQALAQLSKLDSRFKDKQEITHNGPMVIGWDVSDVKEDNEPEKVLTDSELDMITDETVLN